MSKLSRGCVHVYTGNGKGKTTAALGLALRAAGSGLKVYIQQFMKNGDYGEIKALRRLPNIVVEQCGGRNLIMGRPKSSDARCARNGLAEARSKILSGKYDLVILDEINIAVKLGLVKAKAAIELVRLKPKCLELVLTGRGCPASIKKIADVVTEMREIRHPYEHGLLARRGIEY